MEQPNWVDHFKDFPPIPPSKKWAENHQTHEANIVTKILAKQGITAQELQFLDEATNFYQMLGDRLLQFNVGTLAPKELDQFKGYFNFAYVGLNLMQNSLTVNHLLRLVRNSSVPTENGRVMHASNISYPPLAIVKKIGKYNRANTPNSSVFYATETIDSALLELKPPVGEVVTIGLWVPKKGESEILNSQVVVHNKFAIAVNRGAQHGMHAYNKMIEMTPAPLAKYMSTLFQYYSNEFAKVVSADEHQRYFASATLSERLFEYGVQEGWTTECIVYPSVGHSYFADNLAVKPAVLNSKFKLNHLVQFEITETRYSDIPPLTHPLQITVANYKNLVQTNSIDENGNIAW